MATLLQRRSPPTPPRSQSLQSLRRRPCRAVRPRPKPDHRRSAPPPLPPPPLAPARRRRRGRAVGTRRAALAELCSDGDASKAPTPRPRASRPRGQAAGAPAGAGRRRCRRGCLGSDATRLRAVAADQNRPKRAPEPQGRPAPRPLPTARRFKRAGYTASGIDFGGSSRGTTLDATSPSAGRQVLKVAPPTLSDADARRAFRSVESETKHALDAPASSQSTASTDLAIHDFASIFFLLRRCGA